MRRLGSFLFHVAMNGMAAMDKMFAILDEPTSDLDSLNEAVILKVLRDEGAGRTVAVVWVCHVVYLAVLSVGVPLFDIFLIIINKMS